MKIKNSPKTFFRLAINSVEYIQGGSQASSARAVGKRKGYGISKRPKTETIRAL